jgi:biopolymer transport protein TolR
MEINRPSRRKPMSEINVVPLIDVMLVLLIVFMVTAPLITQGIKVDLPQADAEPMEETEEETLVISINGEGQYFINLGDVSSDNPEPVTLEQIGEQVGKIMASNPAVPVYLEGDASIEYRLVTQLMAVLEDAGVPNIALITQPPGLEN